MQDKPAASISIRQASDSDIPILLALIRGLAAYEKLPIDATEEKLRQTLFGDHPYAQVLIASLNEAAIGYALFFHTYSTFRARAGLYLEDLFVVAEHRGKGAGRALLARVAQIARDRKCARLEWSVLDWNQPAIDFYQRVGARVLPDWRLCRMSPEEIANLADSK